MKYLLFRAGADHYAVSLVAVEEVLPQVELKSTPLAAPGVVGVMDWHGVAVPVVDLSLILTGAAVPDRLGSRIVRIRHGFGPGGEPRYLGIRVEGATEVASWEESEFQPPGVSVPGARWLGPVVPTERGLVQRVDLAALLPAEVAAQLWEEV